MTREPQFVDHKLEKIKAIMRIVSPSQGKNESTEGHTKGQMPEIPATVNPNLSITPQLLQRGSITTILNDPRETSTHTITPTLETGEINDS